MRGMPDNPAYFRLTGGIERWLYRVARKHAGRQPKGWLFEVAHLHEKSGSLVRPSEFALQLRPITTHDAFEDSALEAPLGEDGEETLDGVEPTDRGGVKWKLQRG